MNKVIILIDGQNLYHSIRHLELREIDIHWGKFFSGLLTSEDRLLRAYLFRPFKVQEVKLSKTIIQSQSPGTITKAQIQKTMKDGKQWLSREKQKFSEVDFKYGLLEREYEDLEIFRTGVLRLDPNRQKRVGEKGVDVALASKMVEFAITNRCNKIILISGDLDYAEAIKIVKDNFATVNLIYI